MFAPHYIFGCGSAALCWAFRNLTQRTRKKSRQRALRVLWRRRAIDDVGMDLFLCANSRRSVCPACTCGCESARAAGLRFIVAKAPLTPRRPCPKIPRKINRFLKLSRMLKTGAASLPFHPSQARRSPQPNSISATESNFASAGLMVRETHHKPALRGFPNILRAVR